MKKFLIIFTLLIFGSGNGFCSDFRFTSKSCNNSVDYFTPKIRVSATNELLVTIQININCAHSVQKPSYEFKDNGLLILSFESYSQNEWEAACLCGHEVEFWFSDVPKIDKTKIQVIQNGKKLNF